MSGFYSLQEYKAKQLQTTRRPNAAVKGFGYEVCLNNVVIFSADIFILVFKTIGLKDNIEV